MEPFHLSCTGAQIEGERPAPDDDVGVGQKFAAFGLCAFAVRPCRKISVGGELWPGVANFSVEPAACDGQVHRIVHSGDHGALIVGEPLDAQNIQRCHVVNFLTANC